jgi:hypothetical protein
MELIIGFVVVLVLLIFVVPWIKGLIMMQNMDVSEIKSQYQERQRIQPGYSDTSIEEFIREKEAK